jgi:hypothetical protein
MTARFWWRAIAWPKFLRPIVRDRWLHLPDQDCIRIAQRIEHARGHGPVTALIVEAVWDEEIQTPITTWLEGL